MAKSQKTTSKKPEQPPPEDKPQEKVEFIKQLPGILTATATLLGAIITGIIALYNAGLWPFSPAPTPTASPTPAWTATRAPTETPTIPPTSTETPIPLPTLPPTLTFTPEPTGTLSIGCPWRPFSTYDSSLVVANNCLNDLLPWGISGQDPVQFYRERGMNIGIYGISRQWQNPNELSVTLQVNTLKQVRFLVLWSSKEVGYADSIGFLLIREGETREIHLVTYDARGYPETISRTKDLPMWNGRLNLRLEAQGALVKAYVNDTSFGQSQITFARQFLFLGYQVMSGGESKPALYVEVDLP
ncbi:MAG: hypothetical protein DDG60_11915 [Anaerolineae bacterium]|nr:MAG: hypothetical protein DDG60_11915 [Anaerolineae bacterium]